MGQRMKMGQSGINLKHIGVLDGIRAVSVLIIVWFHFWQQSWVIPKIFGISLDWIPRTGYVLVDMLLLLSGFCLFLPHARHMVMGESLENVGIFYVKRLVRILPSYIFCIAIILFAFNLPGNVYGSVGELLKDLLSHLTFTHTFSPDTYMYTKLNVVLWTLAIEMQFYLIFPLLAMLFRKKPLLVWAVMVSLSFLFNGIITANSENINFPMFMNQLPTFLGVYANGMMAALITVKIGANGRASKCRSVICTTIAVLLLICYRLFINHLLKSDEKQVWQVEFRFPLSVLYSGFIIGAVFAARWFRALLSNRVMVLISGISFNLYIWHQFLAVKLKELRIPPWSGDIPPNQTGDTAWMGQYLLLIWVVGIAAAIAATYLVERPAAAWLLRKRSARLK